jgi:transposase-like protein
MVSFQGAHFPLEREFHRRKRPVWLSWRRDETYIRVKG